VVPHTGKQTSACASVLGDGSHITCKYILYVWTKSGPQNKLTKTQQLFLKFQTCKLWNNQQKLTYYFRKTNDNVSFINI